MCKRPPSLLAELKSDALKPRHWSQVCRVLRDETGLNEAALSGGVWQNLTLLGKTLDLLESSGFTTYTHRVVPPNDGGLALGQAAVANHQLKDRICA